MKNGRDRAAVSTIGDSFDEVVLPHLDAAYRLARWLMRNEDDAEDAVQEAPSDTFRQVPAGMGVPGSSESFAIPVVAGAVAASRP